MEYFENSPMQPVDFKRNIRGCFEKKKITVLVFSLM